MISNDARPPTDNPMETTVPVVARDLPALLTDLTAPPR